MESHGEEIVHDALHAGSEKLGLSFLSAAHGARGLRCKELQLSLNNREELGKQSHLSGATANPRQGVPVKYGNASGDDKSTQLAARLTDPLDDLDILLRYQRAIRKDRDNAIDQFFFLKRRRGKLEKPPQG